MPVRMRKHRRPLSLEDWPDVDERALPEPGRSIFRARRKAVEIYSNGGATLERVTADTGLHRAALFRLIDRALCPHPDGKLWGYRALVAHKRVQTYERTAPAHVLVHVKAGNAGVFSQLLQRHPSLAKQLREEATCGRVYLRASGQRGRLVGLKAAVGRFHDACRELGLGGGDYPLNQQDKAVRTMARALRDALDDNFVRSARAAGTRIKPASALRQSTRAILEAFDTVEYDAHKLDLRLKVVLEQDPLGAEHSLEIERLWLLAVFDVATRCVLGWSLGFGRECSRFDAIETIKRALVPPDVPQLTLPGLKLMRSGGFVSQVLPQTQFACWRQIRLDNARAHLATTSLDVLCDCLGCTADFGPAYEPDDRPFIERFFGTLTTTLSRRLPGAIPPRSRQEQEKTLQRLRDPKESMRLLVTAQELQELLEVTIWNYHGTPHTALGGLTPLEMMSRHVLGLKRPAIRLRVLPAPLRRQPMLLHDPVSCIVRGQVARGEKPYITYMHVRYTSSQLARRPGLVGQSLRVHADPQDLRQLVVTTDSGDMLEPLLASGPWRDHPHSLWLRRAFFKAQRQRQLDFSTGLDPIEAFLTLRRKQASKSKRAATDISRAEHDRAKGVRSATPLPPADPLAPAQASAVATLLTTQGSACADVAPRPIRIARGFAR